VYQPLDLEKVPRRQGLTPLVAPGLPISRSAPIVGRVWHTIVVDVRIVVLILVGDAICFTCNRILAEGSKSRRCSAKDCKARKIGLQQAGCIIILAPIPNIVVIVWDLTLCHSRLWVATIFFANLAKLTAFDGFV
jgi:hypothetical protein